MGQELHMPAAFVALQKQQSEAIVGDRTVPSPAQAPSRGTVDEDTSDTISTVDCVSAHDRTWENIMCDDYPTPDPAKDPQIVTASTPQQQLTSHDPRTLHTPLPKDVPELDNHTEDLSMTSLGSDYPNLYTHTTSTSSFQGGVDRYGFKKHTMHISEDQFNAWNIKYEKYCARRKHKWLGLLKESGLAVEPGKAPVRFPPMSQKLKRYVRKGIPPEWRGNAWWWYAHGQDKLNAHRGLYARLVEESAGLHNSDTEHIERDLHRTFPDNIYFRSDPVTGAEAPHVSSLRRVLTAFSVYSPKIGYCQSLNFIAGNLLLFADEERAFWMLVIITQKYLTGLHEVNLEQVNISQGILMISVRDRLPKIWNSLGLEELYEDNFVSNLPPISLCTASWFMSMMVNVLPTETMMRVWDCFFVEGDKVLYRIALTMFKLVEPALSKNADDIEVFQAIQSVPRQLLDPAVLMGACFKRTNGFGHLSSDDIAVLKEFVQSRRRAAQAGKPSQTTDRDEYARFHPGRRLRAKLSLYR